MAGRAAAPMFGPGLAFAAAPIAAIAILVACDGPAPRRVASSSTIALSEDGARVVVTSPDDDTVVILDATDGSEGSRIALEGRPEQLAWVSTDSLVVTLGAAGGVAWVDLATGETSTSEVPCSSTRSVVVDAERAFVSCPDDDRIVEVDVVRRSVLGARHVAGAPSGLALFGSQLGVSLARAGALAVLEFEGAVALVDAPLTLHALETQRGHAASQSEPLSADPIGGFSVAFQRVEHDADRERDPSRGGYGSVVDGAPRIEPRLWSPCGERYARFDGGALAMSGPSAVATAAGLVWVAHMYTDSVLVARCTPDRDAPSSSALDVMTTYRVGRAPRGLALSSDGRTAYVDNGFDWAVSRLDAPADARARTEVTWTRRRTRGAVAMSELALRGRSLFFDAVDTHLTPSGVVTCGTCHPRGGEDGLSWFLHTNGVPRKLRRTPPAWGARAQLSPFHWDGEFGDAALLSRRTTEELMEGDGLLIDFNAIAAYMAEVPLPSAGPVDDPAAAERGRGIFVSAGCEGCHSGELFADGELHSVVPPSDDSDAHVARVSTPSLRGVRTRAPYFHDGRATTLQETLEVPDDLHGRTRALDDAARTDLVTYLNSL